MNLDFLDYGLPLEPDYSEDKGDDVTKFRKYCKELGKEPSDLTDEELKRFYKIIESPS